METFDDGTEKGKRPDGSLEGVKDLFARSSIHFCFSSVSVCSAHYVLSSITLRRYAFITTSVTDTGMRNKKAVFNRGEHPR